MDGIDFPTIEPFVPFLTNALEFIFAASDFIDAGWDAAKWYPNAGGWGHNFARFRNEYVGTLAALKLAVKSS